MFEIRILTCDGDMHLYDDIGDASSSLWRSTSSCIAAITHKEMPNWYKWLVLLTNCSITRQYLLYPACVFFSLSLLHRLPIWLCGFFHRQLIYNYPEQLFADAGVMAIEHADFDGIERLALVTGGEIVSTFDNPDLVKLGSSKVVEEVSGWVASLDFLWGNRLWGIPMLYRSDTLQNVWFEFQRDVSRFLALKIVSLFEEFFF